jgi:CheY-like chemotaxis protein
LNSIDVDGVVKVYAIEETHSDMAIVMKDCQGTTLSHFIKTRRVSIDDFLKIALTLASVIDRVHKLGIIHKDINPNNLIWDENSGKITLLDFETASLIARESSDIQIPGIDAMQKIKSAKPDVITLDIMMPTLNGFDVAAMLKNDPESRDIPIVVISVVDDRERGFNIGVDRYFTKPIDSELLMAAVGELVDKSVNVC